MKIQNEFLSIEINEHGGCFKSIFDLKRNSELLYQPDQNVDSWKGQDIFIFPFINKLENGTYFVDKKEYSLLSHGLLRYMDGKATKLSSTSLEVVFESNPDTLERYPFNFLAKAIYELKEKQIFVKYVIKNTGNLVLPFSVGGHPAFKVPGTKNETNFNIDGNKIVFDKELDLKRVDMDPTYTFYTHLIPYINTKEIELSKDLFKTTKTIILEGKDINYVDLVKKDDSILRIHSNNSKFLTLWTDQKFGDFVAIEPWDGLPERVNPMKNIYMKDYITFLNSNDEYEFNYSIEVIK